MRCSVGLNWMAWFESLFCVPLFIVPVHLPRPSVCCSGSFAASICLLFRSICLFRFICRVHLFVVPVHLSRPSVCCSGPFAASICLLFRFICRVHLFVQCASCVFLKQCSTYIQFVVNKRCPFPCPLCLFVKWI